MAIMIDTERISILRVAPRLLQVLRVFARHKLLGALFGKRHWPPPKEVRETAEELGLVFLKFGQVLAPCGATCCRPPTLMSWRCCTTNCRRLALTRCTRRSKPNWVLR
ncbi:hypothetical protein ACCAA_1430001 [Candidatus Accumulibacter aalborgensis]|uniref:Uncharacterized protein n=1 Tax=Candidatus Accumulibacter aalborgensis TaxID=1860102 RepID=A0A1A8XJA1_9PROT|nr:hypothetical protein ACCAA_1430001 [Candidatus Accumulibacter aalborgensis]